MLSIYHHELVEHEFASLNRCMKALVQEMASNLTSRLPSTFGVKVGEWTSDSELTKQQISETQITVMTPEEWHVITRNSTDASYANLARLMIIDEIHLFHDERGPGVGIRFAIPKASATASASARFATDIRSPACDATGTLACRRGVFAVTTVFGVLRR